MQCMVSIKAIYDHICMYSIQVNISAFITQVWAARTYRMALDSSHAYTEQTEHTLDQGWRPLTYMQYLFAESKLRKNQL